ncbi:hypothetical protein GCM10022222_57070 [Amycolatopsis ultiminotia]|uniref:Uncharacterized protein n=1 Tax=Amycolatopsis ultiminotia TaxID=543629 RepID=A0ABP6XGI9_9PSEU
MNRAERRKLGRKTSRLHTRHYAPGTLATLILNAPVCPDCNSTPGVWHDDAGRVLTAGDQLVVGIEHAPTCPTWQQITTHRPA